MVYQTLIRLFLHDQGDKGNSFCKISVKEMDNGRLAAVVQLGRAPPVAGVASRGTSVPRIHREASTCGPCPRHRLQMQRAAADLLAHGEGLVARVL
jgi:hypothetical protein